jgi:hypothetical protein
MMEALSGNIFKVGVSVIKILKFNVSLHEMQKTCFNEVDWTLL